MFGTPSTSSGTLQHRLDAWAREAPDAVAQRKKSAGSWVDITAREYRDRVFYFGLYLESLGVRPGDVSVIFSYNSPEWAQAELGAQLVGAYSAGLYPNSAPKDIDYVLQHTQAKVLVVQDREYFDRMVGKNGERKLPESIQCVIVVSGDTSIHPRAVAWTEVMRLGKDLSPGKAFSEYLGRMQPKAGAYLIYTSGTTGNPKGALLSHDNLVFAADVIRDTWKIPDGGETFSFLPLCHIAEKLQTLSVGITSRLTVNSCSKFEHLAQELGEVKPTLFLAVPRVWEKVMEGVEAKLKAAPPARVKLARWALDLGRRQMMQKYGAGVAPEFTVLDRLQYLLAQRLVISKVRAALGFHRMDLGASGASALPAHVAAWFRQIGVDIYEDYGQTESTGILCMTVPGQESSGTVGHPAPGTEFRLAADGEIQTRGRHVFLGYFKNDEATRETVQDGWLCTGDLGEFNERGQVRIRGRKKEIMKTSGGKMIAPVPIEDQLKANSVISQVCMVGDNRKYLTAIVTLKETVIADLKKRGVLGANGIVEDREVVDQVQKVVNAVNQDLASYERIKYFTVLSRDFTVEDGEMTPTMKMKRNVIESRYAPYVEAMYQRGE